MHRPAFILLALVAGLAQAQVHRCTGPDGKTIYSDAPCPGGGGQVRLTDNAAGTVRAPPAARAPAIAEQAPRPPAGPACPGDQELRNLETAASSVTVSRDEKERRALDLRAAQACRANGTSFSDELRRLQEQQAQDQNRRRDVGDFVRRCTVGAAGQLICPHR